MLPQHPLSADATPLPPGMTWLKDDCAARGGFFLETEHHMISYTPGSERLVVCFDNLTSGREKEQRVPFGFPLMIKKGWAVLGVMAKRLDWFQCDDLKDKLLKLRDLGLFEKYPDVSLYGSSMGGFGAMTFSALAPNPTVVAFAPQSTLRPRIAQFERRYWRAMKMGNWAEPFSDAARVVPQIGKAYVMFDPFVLEDKLHAERMKGENVETLPMRHFTHKVPPMLKRMEILKPLVLDAIERKLTRESFYKMLRVRRNAAPYLMTLVNAAQAKGHLELGVHAAEQARTYVDNWKTRQAHRAILQARDQSRAETTQ